MRTQEIAQAIANTDGAAILHHLIRAAEEIDWHDSALHGRPPCFHFEHEAFCMHAESWSGHAAGRAHRFISLAEMLRLLTK